MKVTIKAEGSPGCGKSTFLDGVRECMRKRSAVEIGDPFSVDACGWDPHAGVLFETVTFEIPDTMEEGAPWRKAT